MHQVNLTAPIQFPSLEPGSYLAADSAAAEILAYNPDSCTISAAPFFKKQFTPDRDWNGKRVLVTRMGAGGDVLAVTPALRRIKTLWPECRIDFACLPRIAPVLQHNPDIYGIVGHPIPVDDFARYDAVVWLDDNYAEQKEFGKTVSLVDLALKRFGFDPADCDKTLRYVVTEEERAAAITRFGYGPRKRIVCQMSASEPARTWPRENLCDFAVLAIKAGFQVVWIGNPGETGNGKTPPPKHLIDATRERLSIRESAALLSTADAGVFPDSLWYHVASAFGLPGVGLFASFDSRLRETSPYIFNVNGRVGCKIAPCFHHSGRPGIHVFPEAGICSRTGKCEALAEIKPERVLSLLVKQIEAHEKRNGAPA